LGGDTTMKVCAKEDIQEFVDTTIYKLFKVFEIQEDFHALIEAAKSSAVKILYGKGGSMSRGYLNPSPVYELIVGNVKRGRLLRHSPKNLAGSYEYYFNQDNRLVYVKEYTDLPGRIDEELLVYRNNDLFSIYFDNPSKKGYVSSVFAVTCCSVDDLGHLVQYDYLNLVPWFRFQDKSIFLVQEAIGFTGDIRTECYYYKEGKLSDIEIISYVPHIPFPPEFEIVTLQTNQNFEITGYDVCNAKNNRVFSFQVAKPFHISNGFYLYSFYDKKWSESRKTIDL
jgi:hypothetical protein